MLSCFSGKKQGAPTLLPGFTPTLSPWVEMPSIVRPRDIRGVCSAADSNPVQLVSPMMGLRIRFEQFKDTGLSVFQV